MSIYDRDWYKENQYNKKGSRFVGKGYLLTALFVLIFSALTYVTSSYISYPATISLIVVNVIIFVLIKLKKFSSFEMGMSYPLIMDRKEYYRIVSGAFTHEEPLHIIFNMYSMYNIGCALEPALGTKLFIIIYIVILVGGGLFSFVVHGKFQQNALCIGASGTICGLLGVYAVIIFSIYGLTGLRSVISTVIILVLMTASKKIDSIGHFTGLAVGILCGMVLTKIFLFY